MEEVGPVKALHYLVKISHEIVISTEAKRSGETSVFCFHLH
jgi:hypothetical protein